MKVKVRRGYLGAEGRTHKDQVLDISEQRFRQLTEGIHARNPLVDAMEVGYKMEPVLKNKMEPDPMNKNRIEPKGSSISFRRPSTQLVPAKDLKGVSIGYHEEAAKDGAVDPTRVQPAGGQTGAMNPASLSEPAPQRVKRKYTWRNTALA